MICVGVCQARVCGLRQGEGGVKKPARPGAEPVTLKTDRLVLVMIRGARASLIICSSWSMSASCPTPLHGG